MPHEIQFDARGNLYIADMLNHRVRRVAPNGIITTVAGNGGQGFAGDGGPATRAQFNQPHGFAIDPNDNVYVCDVLNHRIRRVDARTGELPPLRHRQGLQGCAGFPLAERRTSQAIHPGEQPEQEDEEDQQV